MKVELVAWTTGAGKWFDAKPEQVIMRAARESNPQNQMSDDVGLLRYCMRKGHWSIWETASMTLEIETSRAIGAQVMRHRSFTFQEFSQRYAPVQAFEPIELRYQHATNRQSSLPPSRSQMGEVEDFEDAIKDHQGKTRVLYEAMLESGIAKESARFILPMNAQTRFCMTGNARSWMFYIQERLKEGVQYEHQLVAMQADRFFAEVFPITHEAMTQLP